MTSIRDITYDSCDDDPIRKEIDEALSLALTKLKIALQGIPRNPKASLEKILDIISAGEFPESKAYQVLQEVEVIAQQGLEEDEDE